MASQDCIICYYPLLGHYDLEGKEMKVACMTGCGHLLHTECLQQWLREKAHNKLEFQQQLSKPYFEEHLTCPTCRVSGLECKAKKCDTKVEIQHVYDEDFYMGYRQIRTNLYGCHTHIELFFDTEADASVDEKGKVGETSKQGAAAGDMVPTILEVTMEDKTLKLIDVLKTAKRVGYVMQGHAEEFKRIVEDIKPNERKSERYKKCGSGLKYAEKEVREMVLKLKKIQVERLLKEQFIDLNSTIDLLDAHCKTNEHLQSLDLKINNQQREVDVQVRMEIDRLENLHSHMVRNLEEQKAVVERDLAVERERVREGKEREKALKKEVDGRRRTVKSLEGKLKKGETALEKAKKNEEKAKQDNKDAQAKLKKQEAEITKLKAALEAAQQAGDSTSDAESESGEVSPPAKRARNNKGRAIPATNPTTKAKSATKPKAKGRVQPKAKAAPARGRQAKNLKIFSSDAEEEEEEDSDLSMEEEDSTSEEETPRTYKQQTMDSFLSGKAKGKGAAAGAKGKAAKAPGRALRSGGGKKAAEDSTAGSKPGQAVKRKRGAA